MWKPREPATARDIHHTSSSNSPNDPFVIFEAYSSISRYTSSENMHLPLTTSDDSDICSVNNHLCGPVSFSPIGSSTRSAYQPFLFPKALQSNFPPPCLPRANHHSLATPEYCTCAILRPSWLWYGYELKIGQIG